MSKRHLVAVGIRTFFTVVLWFAATCISVVFLWATPEWQNVSRKVSSWSPSEGERQLTPLDDFESPSTIQPRADGRIILPVDDRGAEWDRRRQRFAPLATVPKDSSPALPAITSAVHITASGKLVKQSSEAGSSVEVFDGQWRTARPLPEGCKVSDATDLDGGGLVVMAFACREPTAPFAFILEAKATEWTPAAPVAGGGGFGVNLYPLGNGQIARWTGPNEAPQLVLWEPRTGRVFAPQHPVTLRPNEAIASLSDGHLLLVGGLPPDSERERNPALHGGRIAVVVCLLLGAAGIALLVRRRGRPELTAHLLGLLIGGIVSLVLLLIGAGYAFLSAVSYLKM